MNSYDQSYEGKVMELRQEWIAFVKEMVQYPRSQEVADKLSVKMVQLVDVYNIRELEGFHFSLMVNPNYTGQWGKDKPYILAVNEAKGGTLQQMHLFTELFSL